MDVLFTAAAVGAMVLALLLLGRTWPRSSRLGGYRAGRGAGREGASGEDRPGGADSAGQEDDDVRWRWGGE